jgi:outer membrane protein OmpA-like peptidoglycan-associated protein
MNSIGGQPTMPKFCKVFVCFFVFIFLNANCLLADLILTKDGDKLFGKILNLNVALDSPYGQIVIRNDFLKKLTFDENRHSLASIQSINNDVFSGTLLTDQFQIRLEQGEQKSIGKSSIKMIKMDTHGPSYKITTAVFSMKNNDKFSGKVLTSDWKIRTGYMITRVKRDTINRIEMLPDRQEDVKILLDNGDLITGKLMEEHIQVVPDVIAQLTLSKSSLRSIQFNADKMVLNELSRISPAEMDTDGDSVPDQLEKGPDTPCPQTPEGVWVDARDCMAGKEIFFDFDKFNLRSEYYPLLDNVISMLRQNPILKVQIQGHTDSIGTAEYNQKLSEKRAWAVKNYLTSNGIGESRLSTVGYGDTKNKTANDTPSGRALNRRAEIVPLN